MNLLGLCYYHLGEHQKAVYIFKKVVEAENNSVRALKYLNTLNRGNESDGTGIKRRKIKVSNVSLKKVILSFLYNKNGRLDFIKYGTGFIIGGLIVFAITLPSIQGKKEENVPSEDIEAIKTQLNEEIDLYKSKYNEANDKYEALLSENESLLEELNYQPARLKLLEIENMYLEGKYEKAADTLLIMKTVELKDEDKNKFGLLWETVMPAAADVAYEEGMVLCRDQKKYEDALKKLEKVHTYVDSISKEDGLLYWLGRSYQGLGNYDNALESYNKIISDYPKSSYIQWVPIRIREIEAG
jgi:tetratricopeptide (TPR) repeat protein